MKLDVEALAAKHGGEVFRGGVLAEINGIREWLAKVDDHGVAFLTPLGEMIEASFADVPPRRGRPRKVQPEGE